MDNISYIELIVLIAFAIYTFFIIKESNEHKEYWELKKRIKKMEIYMEQKRKGIKRNK